MKHYFFILLLIAIPLTGYAQHKDTEAHRFNEDKLLERLKTLSSDQYKGRRTGEIGNDSARAYIIKEFKALGVYGFKGNFEQGFAFKSRSKTIEGVNILAELKGSEYPEKYMVVSAHYDHLGIRNDEIYNGADDNASGVSALLSFAEYLVKHPPRHTVIFAAFDAEEMSLQGAKYFVDTIAKEKVLLNINMDMISRSPEHELYVVGGRYDEVLKKCIEEFDNPTSTKLLVGHDGTDGKENWTMSSDHAPFHKQGIPFLYFGNEDHDAYHEPTDDFEDITPEFYLDAVKIILSILTAIDEKGL